MSNGAGNASNIVLRAEHVGKTYPDGATQALVDVSLQIPRGQFVAILGPSGSGKSTLLNLLGCIDRPTTGEILFEEQPVSQIKQLDRLRAERIGFIFQSFLLLNTLTAEENVRIAMLRSRMTRVQRKERAKALLEQVGVAHRASHLPSMLSVGERQRVAIARALANEPVLILADEPTGNLDSRNATAVLDLLAHMHRTQHATLVVVTHSDAVAERAERILRMEDGRLVQDVDVKVSTAPQQMH